MSSTPSNSRGNRQRIRDVMRPTLVTPPLLEWLSDANGGRRDLIIELNTRYPGGLMAARVLIEGVIRGIAPAALNRNLPGAQHCFVFAGLQPSELAELLEKDSAAGRVAQSAVSDPPLNAEPVVHRDARAIRKVWESAPIQPLTTVSIRTVKADAAHAAFTALGQSITWAVLDSGIEGAHAHFVEYDTLQLTPPLRHRSFVPLRTDGTEWNPLQDEFGHGTHVAGIIAGGAEPDKDSMVARQSVDATGRNSEFHIHPVGAIGGMAPKCKLMSLRVLDDSGNGDVTSVINALEWLIQLNGDGSNPLVHGVNLSAGYLPDPETYGSGQSPICRQVNRAVRSGLVVVVAAGNFGYAAINAVQEAGALRQWDAGAFASISDPANAELSIAVGSTHREEPHRYGVSYFSSKGPTCDGRRKPDIVAPGERILSCAAGAAKQHIEAVLQLQQQQAQPPANAAAAATQFDYLEDTGTSMAAPHVSGVIAAFLSVRREFIGEPEKVAKLVVSSAVDLERDLNLQGAGLIDLFPNASIGLTEDGSMLAQYGGFPAFEVMYDTGGHLVDPTAESDAVSYFGTGAGNALTDLFVISHGWNNDISEARTLYHDFFNAFAAAPDPKKAQNGRSYGVVALFWPSKRFADSSLISGGAAGLTDPATATVLAQIDQFADLFAGDSGTDAKITHLKSLVPLLNFSANAQDDYVSTLASLVPKPRYETDEGLDNARDALGTLPGRQVLANLATPLGPTTAPLPGSGGASGLLGGITSAAANLGDLLTYFTMKDRAGIVGRTGAVGTIRALLGARAAAATHLKIHLIGHSFGGRLVTSAANSLNGSSAAARECVDSMTLLEAAYSHNGLAANWDGKGSDGGFRSVISQVKVKGPILISHSSHDFPVGTAYPLASRLRGQVADALIGGPNDIYGGMGRNGAQKTPEVLTDLILPAADGTVRYPDPSPNACWILNICGDGPPPAPTITGHSDVAKPELVAIMLNYI